MNIIINIKKKSKKNVVLLINIHDNENWAVIGKSRIVEEWINDDNKEKENENEKNIKVILLPLSDGFLKLPEIEICEYVIEEKKEEKNIKINEDNESKDEIIIGKMNFLPIEYGTSIEGNERVLKITPITESSLKLNLT